MSNLLNSHNINSGLTNCNQILNNAPLTLVATSNCIGGITLTALGSLHQHHQQQQQQQQQLQNQQIQQQLQQQIQQKNQLHQNLPLTFGK